MVKGYYPSVSGFKDELLWATLWQYKATDKDDYLRGGSIESYRENEGFIGCTQGYDDWFHKNEPNPNVVVGALVGGPDQMDEFRDDRKIFIQTEACTYNTASLVGVLAKLHGLEED
ncbi:hypothetical protein F3Y22_tig00000640pilonHSYRG00008 [Hibiscus syriacus]|uniref:cellulase n=1 Tax=Hibiscus syriacus TaxID=106335 RepID=A0A6A3D6R2_HIBSY|nr:hypothetical protein F3Y22_tig00000640pilonHSYRG00008 [Hibiscus syriacus]